MRRPWLPLMAATAALLITAAPVLGCGGLIGPNGAVNLLRTTTFAGYHGGVEHYVTSFEFAGGGGAFGSITPLPDIPNKVERGGDWTLQRLIRETDPAPATLDAFANVGQELRGEAEVLLETTIDALDITILRGGGDEVGLWAKNHGFRLPPDSPEVLDFYAERSPIFMAAAFDADAAAARGQAIGDGTPIHLTIPTDNPWVPLRILALGKAAAETVQADVYLLTDERPALLPNVRGVGGADPRPQRSRQREPPHRSALRRGHGVGPRRRVADEGRHRRKRRGAELRPGHRCVWRGSAVADRRGLRAVPTHAGSSGADRPLPGAGRDARRGRADRPRPGDASELSSPSPGRRMSRLPRLAVAALLLAATVTAGCAASGPTTVTITIHYSAFDLSEVSVPRGVPVTFVLVNDDPIDHEWLIGDEAFHEKHRTGTHEAHGDVTTEVTIPALETMRTTITFDEPGTILYICHLPGHEAYGMVGTLTVEG